MPQRQVGGLDLPPLVVEPDQGGGRVAAVVEQRGDQPVAVADPAAVGAGHGHVGLDDPHGQPVQVATGRSRRAGAPGPGVAGGLGAGQQHRPGGVRPRRGRRSRRRPGRASTSMPGPQQGQQPPGQVGLVPVGRRAERGAEQAAGAGLGQRHQPQRRVPGEAHPVADPAQPGPVAVGVGDLQRVQPSKATVRSPAKRHPGRARLGQRPGDHLEQRLQRRRAEPAAQVPQRLLRRARHVQPGQPGGQLGPDPGIAQPREHPQREHEVHPGPRRQHPQPPLHRPGLLQDVIDQLERQVLGQLAQMTRGEHPRGDGDGTGDRGQWQTEYATGPLVSGRS